MATISTLAVNLIARTSVFEKGMKRSRKVTKSLNSTVQGAVGTMAKFGRALASIAAAAGLGIVIKRTLSAIDATAKMSSELQISTESLIALDQAAQISGTTIQTVQKSLQIMVRRLGEARAGYGEGKKGLDAMGVSAQAMIDMGTEKAFLKIADAVKDAGTAAEKANIAYQLFGRSGVNMINLLNEGSAGFREMEREVRKFGTTFSKLDAKKVEDANDAIVDLKSSLKGLAQQATITFAPFLEKTADFTRTALAMGRGWKEVQDIAKGVAKENDKINLSMENMVVLAGQQAKFKDRELSRAKELKLIKEQEEAAFSSINKFVQTLMSELDTVGLDPLFKQLDQMEKLGDALTGEAWVEWNRGMNDAAGLIDELITKREALEQEKETPDAPGGIRGGRFQQIRSEFIDVAALNAGGSTQGVNKTNALLLDTNATLKRIANQGEGTAPL